MSREIKFRAWVKKKKKYCNIDQLDFNFEGTIEDVWIWEDESILVCASYAEVIMERRLDLHDKHGKWIYEGDIIKMYDRVFIIRWIDTAFSFMASGEKESYWLSPEKSYDIEVIGNIHENQKLLNDAKKPLWK